MPASLLHDLIASFSPAEARGAADWLACPEHNRREDVQLLLSAYLNQPAGEEERPAALFAAARPGEDYDDQGWRLLKTYLLQRLEDWLAYRAWQEAPPAERGPWLLRAYRERNLTDHLATRLTRLRKQADRHPALTSAGTLAHYQLEQLHFDRATSASRQQRHNLAAKETALDATILSLKLRDACQTLSSTRLTGGAADIPLLEACLELAELPALAHLPALRPYYLGCRLMTTQAGHGGYFQQYREFLFTHLSDYPGLEQRDLLLIALNYCVARINEGDTGFHREALDLYRLGLDRQLLYRRGLLSLYTFNNIVGIALRLEETEWVSHFLNDHRDRLPAADGPEVFALNAARLAYARADYAAALVHLRTADYRDFIHLLSAHTLRLKIYFQLDHQHLLGAHLTNTRALLNRRRKVAAYHLENYRNIFRLAQLAYRLPPGPNNRRSALRETIRTTDPLTEREWLAGLVGKNA